MLGFPCLWKLADVHRTLGDTHGDFYRPRAQDTQIRDTRRG